MKKFSYLTFFIVVYGIVSPAQAAKRLEGDGYLQLHNVHANEDLKIQYRTKEGRYDPKALLAISQLLRCRLTGHTHAFQPKLIELIDRMQDHFGGRPVFVVSGYRSPQFNEALRASGHKVAKNSRHMMGYAMDITIPGIAVKELRDYAISLKMGGVGYYPHHGFVHVDVDRVRYW